MTLPVEKKLTREIPIYTRYRRVGIIPYTIVDGVIYYCLAVDVKHVELTDFGGGSSGLEDFVQGATRELKEESLTLFDYTDRESVDAIYSTSFAIHVPNRTIIIFQHLIVEDMRKLEEEFREKAVKDATTENSGIRWIREDIFSRLIESGSPLQIEGVTYPNIYIRVRELLLHLRRR
jgi:hypothetical protein